MATKERRVRGELSDGSYVLIPKWAKDKFVGIDEYGNPVIRDIIAGAEEELTAISFCCGAHGKGSADAETGVVCRNCYGEVEGLGYPLDESQIMVRALNSETVAL